MSAALDNRHSRAVRHLLAHCAEAGAKPRRPVFDRLRDVVGTDLARRLVSALSSRQRARSRRAL